MTRGYGLIVPAWALLLAVVLFWTPVAGAAIPAVVWAEPDSWQRATLVISAGLALVLGLFGQAVVLSVDHDVLNVVGVFLLSALLTTLVAIVDLVVLLAL